MISRIVWPERYRGRRDPFSSNDSSLKLTLDEQSFIALSKDQEKALALLYELGRLSEVSLFCFENNSFNKISFRESSDAFNLRVDLIGGGTSFHAGFSKRNIGEAEVNGLLILEDSGYTGLTKENAEKLREELKRVEAHEALDNHLFVTNSIFFLNKRGDFARANIKSPSEALKIVGSFLRTRENKIYQISDRSRSSIGKSLFYREEFLGRIPSYLAGSFWKKRAIYGDELFQQCLSFAEKCCRTIRTKDTLSSLFYRMQDEEVRDSQLYYFDYLTLLLAGAYDSLAEISNILFGLKHKRRISFRNRKFVDSFKATDSDHLIELLKDSRILGLETMLFKLRNTVHHIVPTGRGEKDFDRHEETYIELDYRYRDEIWQAALSLEGVEPWGLKRDTYSESSNGRPPEKKYRIKLEPYAYSVMLFNNWFDVFDKVLKSLSTTNTIEENISEREMELAERVRMLGGE